MFAWRLPQSLGCHDCLHVVHGGCRLVPARGARDNTLAVRVGTPRPIVPPLWMTTVAARAPLSSGCFVFPFGALAHLGHEDRRSCATKVPRPPQGRCPTSAWGGALPLHILPHLVFMGLLAALQPLCRWWFCSESVVPGARGGSCLHINPPPSQPATFIRYSSMCFVSAPCLSQWLLILGLLCPWFLASFGTWRVPSHWHLYSVNTLLIGAAITSYAGWSFHRSAIPLKASSPWAVLGGERQWSPDARLSVTISFKGGRRVR
jgi:hypothetical protein